MTYDTSNPPQCVVPAVGGKGPAIWTYEDGDDDATVNGADYFTNGEVLGMQVGDVVFVYDTATPKTSFHYVSAIDSDGNATVSFGAVA
ncbi:MAG: hypothetical protein KDA32_14865 [Phycisphaerales bacterium]|nr:hypothetical protein [Phycisphaerales bacterium]